MASMGSNQICQRAKKSFLAKVERATGREHQGERIVDPGGALLSDETLPLGMEMMPRGASTSLSFAGSPALHR
jgi:hypothetical protein